MCFYIANFKHELSIRCDNVGRNVDDVLMGCENVVLNFDGVFIGF